MSMTTGGVEVRMVNGNPIQFRKFRSDSPHSGSGPHVKHSSHIHTTFGPDGTVRRCYTDRFGRTRPFEYGTVKYPKFKTHDP